MRIAMGGDSMGSAARLCRARFTLDDLAFTYRFWPIVGRQMLLADREEG